MDARAGGGVALDEIPPVICPDPPGPPDVKDTGDAPHVATTLAGTITWDLDFDADAEAAGYVDCTYTRAYDEMVEVGDQPYLCPDCSVITTGVGVMTTGYDDCYTQISDSDAERVEHFGIGTVDGETHFFRTGVENVSLGDLGAIVDGDVWAVAWEDTSDLDEGGTMTLSAAGEIVAGTAEDVLVEDVTGARTEPYTCGWPMNNPGGPVESWTVADGEVFPNVRLEDQCGEAMDLWDFRGYYLVIDSSAVNCGPCQQMAETAEAFRTRMAVTCAPVEMVTLLNASLSSINQPADLDTRLEWAKEFGITSPILADKGAGYALLPEYLGQEDGMSFPSIVVLDPEGRVIYGSSGFGDTTWDTIGAVILDDME